MSFTKHPEERPGEMFLRNCKYEKSFQEISFKSKRKGTTAYDVRGKLVPGAFPVFVGAFEFDQKVNDDIKKKSRSRFGYRPGFEYAPSTPAEPEKV